MQLKHPYWTIKLVEDAKTKVICIRCLLIRSATNNNPFLPDPYKVVAWHMSHTAYGETSLLSLFTMIAQGRICENNN